MPKDSSFTVMAFDYGNARIGVAVGNNILKIPHPLTTLVGDSMYAKIDQMVELIERWQPQLLIVGAPHAADNPQKIQLLNTINNFVKRLKRKFNLPVELVNEDFSSAYAASQLKEQGIYGINQKEKLDQLAACLILEYYFSQPYIINNHIS